ncbi:unnamed protein product [Anisakis simplex]|uniref:DUF5641 domain-containing protein n=1 Tax=Anisakis simplex TaxID=6269 RepID=A0A0M3IY87_ANISI|nr:unnamed protein product [Anisakis simplex]
MLRSTTLNGNLFQQEHQPRTTWALGRIIQLLPSSDGTIRSATVQLANSRKVTRPISLLYLLEIQAKSDTLTSQHQQNKQDKHSEPEQSVQCDNSPLVLRSRTIPRLASFFVLLLTISFTTAYQICPSNSHGIFVALPPRLNCSISDRLQPKRRFLDVYTRSFAEFNGPYCTKIVREVCTNSFLRWKHSVNNDRLSYRSINVSDCRLLTMQKKLNDVSLIKVDKYTWRSNNSTTYSFGFFGTRWTPTINYRLEIGQLKLFDAFSRTAGCNIAKGECITSQETIKWTPSSNRSLCYYKFHGRYDAIIDQHITIPAIQAVLVPSENSTANFEACNIICPKLMENGTVVDFLPSREDHHEKKVSHDRSEKILFMQNVPENEKFDPINTKNQYLYDNLGTMETQDMVETRKAICKTRNYIHDIIEWILQSDPTTAARILLTRTDISAKNEGGTMKIFPRRNIDVDQIFSTYEVNGTCYSELPVRIKNRIAFVKARSTDLKFNSTIVKCDTIEQHRNVQNMQEEERLKLEHDDIIFNARHLPMVTEKQISAAIEMVTHQNDFVKEPLQRAEKHSGTIEPICDETELFFLEIEQSVDKTVQIIENELEEIGNHWKFITGVAETITPKSPSSFRTESINITKPVSASSAFPAVPELERSNLESEILSISGTHDTDELIAEVAHYRIAIALLPLSLFRYPLELPISLFCYSAIRY